MCLRRAPEKYIAGAALDRAGLGLCSCLFPFGVPNKFFFALRSFIMRAACPTYHILFEFMILTIFVEGYVEAYLVQVLCYKKEGREFDS
jgi:hypothetical protein